MKKRLILACMAACAALLCACSVQTRTAWETVDDEIAADCASWQSGAKIISFEVPAGAGAQELDGSGARQVYAAADGAYEIVAEVLLDTSVDSVVRSLTGFPPERVQVVETRCGELPEYQFAWYAGSDEGGRLYRVDVVLEEPYCYTLLFSTSEQSGTKYDSIAARVFASMSLADGDGV